MQLIAVLDADLQCSSHFLSIGSILQTAKGVSDLRGYLVSVVSKEDLRVLGWFLLCFRVLGFALGTA
jgi:hypothetical protein